VTPWPRILANILAFNALWWVTMLGVGRPWWWVGPALVPLSLLAQARFSPAPRRELTLILAGAALGTLLDGASLALGFMAFSAGVPVFALTFLALWINFGTTLRPSLAWLWRRPALAAVLGAGGGVSAYWGAAALGGVEFPAPAWRGLAWAAAQYALATPLWMFAASRVLANPAPVHSPSAPGATR
jgi:hypothetical protein